MKQVVLDTSFILIAIRNKLDFLEEISFLGLAPVIPKQVIGELKKITDSRKKLRFREEAQLALRLLEKKHLKTLDLKTNYVDKGLLAYSRQNKSVIIATMDKELKQKLPSQKLIIRGKKTLELC